MTCAFCQKAAVAFSPLLWTARGVRRCRLSRAISHRLDRFLIKVTVRNLLRLKNTKVNFPQGQKKKSCFVFVTSFLTLFTSGVFSPHHRLQRHLESHLYHRKCPVDVICPQYCSNSHCKHSSLTNAPSLKKKKRKKKLALKTCLHSVMQI